MQKQNPYIGPRPYGRGEGNFFGRGREGKELAWLILAERAVLFYAQSGAGKTSLLNARVIPILEQKGVQVLPVARVGSALPEGIAPEQVDNIFTFSALLAFSADVNLPPDTLLTHTLLSYLQTYGFSSQPSAFSPQPTTHNPQPSTSQSPTLLIFDQFEEIATTHREHWAEAEGFFRQVREALDALPGLGVLFVLREDYVAELDPYTPLLPSHLQARFRMTLPTRPQAMQIVMGPAEQAGVPFAEEAAHNLVANLSRIKTSLLTSPSVGGTEGGIGQYVEPVQLQVVCQQLWESLPEAAGEDHLITWDEIKDYDVNDALTTFYERVLTNVAQTSGVSERRLRQWFRDQLITSEGRRRPALQEGEATAGLPNTVVKALEDQHLIRAEERSGSRSYELSHDRLVEPIVQSNQKWDAARQTPLRVAAKQWQCSQNEELLYRDKILDEAVAWAKANPDDVEDYENEFLQASQKAQQTYRMKRSRNRMIVGLLISAVIIVAVTLWAVRQSQIATARQLVARAQQIQLLYTTDTGSISSALLAIESMRRSASPEAFQSVYAGLNRLPGTLLVEMQGMSPWNTAVSSNGQWFAATSRDALFVWDTTTWEEVYRNPYDGELSLAFSPDSRWLATGGRDHVVRLRDTTTWTPTVQLEHTDEINAIVFAPNNQWVAAMDVAGTLRIWRRMNDGWVVIRTEPSGPRPVSAPQPLEQIHFTCNLGQTEPYMQTFEQTLRRSIMFSSDGKYLAAIGLDNVVRVWEMDTLSPTSPPVATLRHSDTVLAVAFSPEPGTWLATAGRDNAAHVWQTGTWTEVFSVPHGCDVTALAFSHDAQYLAVGSDDATATIWRVADGKQTQRLPHNGAIWALAFSPDDRRLATGDMGGTARLWDTATGRQGQLMSRGFVWGLTFASDGTWLATSGHNVVNVWSLTSQEIIPRIEHQNAVVDAAFSPDGRWFAAASFDGVVSLWDMQEGVTVKLTYDDTQPDVKHEVWSIAFSPDSQLLAAGCADGHMRVWNVISGSLVAKLRHGESWKKIVSVAWSPDGQWLASGSQFTACVWDVAGGQEIARMWNGLPGIRYLTFSPDGKRLATASYDGTARIWNALTGEELVSLVHENPEWGRSIVWDVAFSPDGTKIATASQDHTARLWDANTGEELIRWGHREYVHEVAFSPDGLWLAAASWDGTVTIWSTKLLVHRPLATLYHIGDPVWTLAFSADGQWLVTGTRYGKTRVWQVLTGQEVFRIETSGAVYAVAFSPNGRWLGTGNGNYASIWNWQSKYVIDEACARLPRNLTRQEWRRYLPWNLYHRICPNLPIPADK